MLSDPQKRAAARPRRRPVLGTGGGFGAGLRRSPTSWTRSSAAPAAPRARGRGQRRGQDALIRIEVDAAPRRRSARPARSRSTPRSSARPATGDGAAPGTSPAHLRHLPAAGARCSRCSRSFLGQVMTARPCAACQGFGTVIPHPCVECGGEGRVRTRRSLTIKVPPGVDTGTRIQLSGEGEVGPGGGPAGDLYVEIVEAPHADVHAREGDDLHCTVKVPMTAAALGTSLTLETLDGDARPRRAARRAVRADRDAARARRHPPARRRPRRPARARRRADPDPARRRAGGAAAQAGRAARRGAAPTRHGRRPSARRSSPGCATRSTDADGPTDVGAPVFLVDGQPLVAGDGVVARRPRGPPRGHGAAAARRRGGRPHRRRTALRRPTAWWRGRARTGSGRASTRWRSSRRRRRGWSSCRRWRRATAASWRSRR